jgi:hypothetical protein
MDTNVQYKGTDLCMDFYCDCGEGSHFDGLFAYVIQCPHCQSFFKMPTDLTLERLESFNPEEENYLTAVDADDYEENE